MHIFGTKMVISTIFLLLPFISGSDLTMWCSTISSLVVLVNGLGLGNSNAVN